MAQLLKGADMRLEPGDQNKYQIVENISDKIKDGIKSEKDERRLDELGRALDRIVHGGDPSRYSLHPGRAERLATKYMSRVWGPEEDTE